MSILGFFLSVYGCWLLIDSLKGRSLKEQIASYAFILIVLLLLIHNFR